MKFFSAIQMLIIAILLMLLINTIHEYKKFINKYNTVTDDLTDKIHELQVELNSYKNSKE